MPPKLRPRPNVSQQPVQAAGRRRVSAAREPQAQSNPSVAPNPTRKYKGRSSKQKGEPSKGKEAERPTLSRTSGIAENNPESRPQSPSSKSSRLAEDNSRSRPQRPPSKGSIVAENSLRSRPRSPPRKTSRLAQDSLRSRSQSPSRRSQIPEQSEPQQPEKEQNKTIRRREKVPSEPEQVALAGGSIAQSRKSAQVASWAIHVHQEGLPEVVGIPTISRPSTLNEYLRSTPWYRNDGFDTSDEDMASPSVATSEVRSKNQEKPKAPRCFELTSSNAVTVLAARNVDFDSVVDDDREWIKDKILPKSDESCSPEEEKNWGNDLAKCQISDEAIFQRTIMMDLINRHQLAGTLDYTCESQWTCPSSMPEMNTELASRMPKPKPDLAVAFKAKSLMPFNQQKDLDKLRCIMCPESSKEVKRDRAFHFLSVEVKGASGPLANWVAHRQNFNTATQALHNIYVFMNLAGKEALNMFYEKVRFYSVVATGFSFHVRAHRAVELKEGRIEKNYPLGFEYDVIYNHQSEGGGYTKAKATAIIRNILIEYGIKTLQPLLKTTMKNVWDSLQSEKNGLPDEAEEQRTRGRTASRHSRGAPAESRLSRKTPSIQAPNASFAREQLDRFTVDSESSSPGAQ